MGTSSNTAADEALSTEVPTLTSETEAVLFEWDGPVSPGADVQLVDDSQADTDEIPGTQMLPLPELTAAPPNGADRWVDAGLAAVLHNRLRADSPGPAVGRVAAHRPEVAVPPTAPAPPLQHPGRGLAAALALGLLAAFFGWVNAAPFWLSHGVGFAERVTVVRCDERCEGRVTLVDGTTRTVRLADVAPADRKPGTTVRARMLSDGDVAYAGPVAGLHLRWMLGFALVLACGVGVGVATGVPRLRREGTRKVTTLWALSLGGPMLLALIPLFAALF